MAEAPDWRKIDTRWVRQRSGDFKSEWYFSRRADLMLWRRRATGTIEKFELTWEPPLPPGDRLYLFWDGRWTCGRVDSGVRPWGMSMTPIVREDHTILDELRGQAVDFLTDLGPEMAEEVVRFVTARLREP